MSFVKYEPMGDIAYLTIDRPSALNALNAQVLSDLSDALDGIDLNTVRCVIVRGAGEKSFVAGADIAQMKDLNAAEGLGDLIDLIHYGPSDSVLLPRCMVEADRVDICLFEDFEKDDDLFGAVHALLDAYAARHPGDLRLRKG